MSSDPHRAQELFLAVVEKSPADRAAHLDHQCAGDEPLRSRVEALLEAHDCPGSFLDRPAPGIEFTDIDRVREKPGDTIGPYRLLEQIGEGGFGVVYLAEQNAPVQRQVALKIIKPGMDTREAVARFEAERQALAMMEHPNIAKVFDAGATESGRPYFVMELVRGVPITEYCDRCNLDTRDRLKTFVCVCRAVQHAHQKGIIHRDIKPTNVLIAIAEGRAAPKVIDFGVAKATAEGFPPRAIRTGFAQMLGTPLYMSPEQAEMSPLDVDTRTDIYSLGVLLYELLTGTTPVAQERLKQAAYDEMRRIIREEVPPRPSARLSTLSAEMATTIAECRRTEPRKLMEIVRGELDWIAMKCLEKDRQRRYDTVDGLAQDVERYLADQPVLACPPSAIYSLRKFLKRNRRPVFAAGVVLAALVFGMVGTTLGLLRALSAESLAEQRLGEVRDARDEIRGALIESEAARRQAQAVAHYLVHVLRSPDPALAGRDVKVADVLARALKELDSGLADQPVVKASLLDAVGQTYLSLGMPVEAVAVLEEALELWGRELLEDDPQRLVALNNLAWAYRNAGQLERALPLYEDVFRRRQESLGADHRETLSSADSLAEAYRLAGRLKDALALHQTTFDRREATLGRGHSETLISMNNLALAYRQLGQLDRAFPLYEEAFERDIEMHGLEHPSTLTSLNNLAMSHHVAGDYQKADEQLRKCFELQQNVLGPDHPDTLGTLNNLALNYKMAGRIAEALPLYEDTLERLRRRLGDKHPSVLMVMNNLGSTYVETGELEKSVAILESALLARGESAGPDHPDTITTAINAAMAYKAAGRSGDAIELLDDALRRSRETLGAAHPTTLAAMNNLAGAYEDAVRLSDALALYEESLGHAREKLGADHPNTLNIISNYARALALMTRFDEALSLFEEVLRKTRARWGAGHPETLSAMRELAAGHYVAGQLELAVALHEQVLPARREKFGDQHPATIQSLNDLSIAYRDAGQPEKALPMAEAALAAFRQTAGDDHPLTLRAMANLGMLQRDLGRLEAAEAMLCDCLARVDAAGVDAWQMCDARVFLGGVLREQRRFDEAEPLLVAGYEGLVARAERIPPNERDRIALAQKQLVKLYEAWGKPDEAARWRTILDRSK